MRIVITACVSQLPEHGASLLEPCHFEVGLQLQTYSSAVLVLFTSDVRVYHSNPSPQLHMHLRLSCLLL